MYTPSIFFVKKEKISVLKITFEKYTQSERERERESEKHQAI
jgi:hypothetical protein